jgi:hypothetical protein
MIIMFHKEQAKVLLQQQWFEVDMSFKRLRNSAYRELVLAIMNEQNHRGNTLL